MEMTPQIKGELLSYSRRAMAQAGQRRKRGQDDLIYEVS